MQDIQRKTRHGFYYTIGEVSLDDHNKGHEGIKNLMRTSHIVLRVLRKSADFSVVEIMEGFKEG